MLRGSKEKEWHYYERDVLEMLDKFLKNGFIELLASQRSEEIRKNNDPKYYKHHMIISNPTEKCKVFKGQILQLANEGKITLDEDDI